MPYLMPRNHPQLRTFLLRERLGNELETSTDKTAGA